MRKSTSLFVVAVLAQVVLSGSVQAFDVLDWLNDFHAQIDWRSAPVHLTEAAQPISFEDFSGYYCDVVTMHADDVDYIHPTFQQIRWQIPFYMNRKLTLGYDGSFSPSNGNNRYNISLSRNTNAGYLRYAITPSLSAMSQVGLSSYNFTRFDGAFEYEGRSKGALTVAAGLRYYLLNYITAQVTFQHVAGTEIDDLVHVYYGRLMPGVSGPPVIFDSTSSILFGIGFHPPIPSFAWLNERAANSSAQAFEDALDPELPTGYQAYARDIAGEITRLLNYRALTKAANGAGITYDEKDKALMVNVQFYDREALYKKGLKRTVPLGEWLGSEEKVAGICEPLREKFLDDFVKILGDQRRQHADLPAKVVIKLRFSTFTEYVQVDSGSPLDRATMMTSIHAANIKNYVAHLEVVRDDQDPLGFRETFAETRLIDEP